MNTGVLYVVATPIGNLEDFSERAQKTLKNVDWIAAEDTRHTQRLCQRFEIHTPKLACHAHNEEAVAKQCIQRLLKGESGALVSDAGTPLLSDPGYILARKAHEHGIRVVPIPGPCSAITALSAAGLPATDFRFIGFLPPKSGARQKQLENLDAGQTHICFESPNRLQDSLTDIVTVLGPDCPMAIARELTKQFEQIVQGSTATLLEKVINEEIPCKGEFVLLLSPPAQAHNTNELEVKRQLAILMPVLPLKKAAECISQITGMPKNQVYSLGLDLKKQD